MKYQPSLPAHNDNVSQENPLKDFAVILGWLLAVAALGYWLLGMAVDATVDNLSDETEAKLHKMLPSYTAPAAAPDLLARQTRLQAMVDGLRSCAGVRLPAAVTLTKSEVPNAAVLAGGQIVIFTGLLDHVRSENGLAFVLAHELAHIAQRDHLRAVGRGIVLFGVAVLVTGNNSGLTELLAPVNSLGQAKYSRTREAAADSAALRILHCRYGHAGGATELFDAMKDRDDGFFGLSHYAASHPAMQSRIDALNRAIRDGGLKVGPVVPLPGDWRQ
jgi:Zn-dependent protease with chaperone function